MALRERLGECEKILDNGLGNAGRELYQGLDAVLLLPELGMELPLAEISDGVVFTPEAVEDAG